VFEIFKWSVAALSLLGVVLNIRRQRACFFIWTATNAAWVVIDVYHGIWSQAALMTTYTGLAVWGIFAWKDK
jgi:nicotinamide riboside transporter PnuC